VRRRLLGNALREYRESLGFNLDEAATILECDRSKVSRIETGERGIRGEELRELLTEYGVPPTGSGLVSYRGTVRPPGLEPGRPSRSTNVSCGLTPAGLGWSGPAFQRRFSDVSACPGVMSGTVSLTTEGNVMSGIFRRHVPPVLGKGPHRREGM
jgi:transcriptional regulator with XRE-family HTH domain